MRRLLLSLAALAVALVTVAAPAPTPAKPSIAVAGPAPVSASGSTSSLGPASEPALRYLIAEVDLWNAGVAAGEAARAAAETPPPAPKPKTPAKPSPAPRTASTGSSSTSSNGSVNGWPCGGDLPPCSVLRRESGGNPAAVNPNGCVQYDPTTKKVERGCFGLWQFSVATWHALGRSGVATDYSGDDQNAAARSLWRGGAGCSNWGAC